MAIYSFYSNALSLAINGLICTVHKWGDLTLVKEKELEVVQHGTTKQFANTRDPLNPTLTEPLRKLRRDTHQTGGMPWFLRAGGTTNK